MSDRYEDNPRPVVDCSDDVVLTQQSDARELDMNVIMARARSGADLSHLANPTEPRFGSLIGLGDLRDAMNLVVKADTLFMELDPFLRKRFNNSPAELLDFVSKAENREEAAKLGLLKPVDTPKVDLVHEEIKGLREDLKAHRGDSGAKKKSPKDED